MTDIGFDIGSDGVNHSEEDYTFGLPAFERSGPFGARVALRGGLLEAAAHRRLDVGTPESRHLAQLAWDLRHQWN